LFFGRIWPYKGLHYFIEAANLLSAVNQEAKFMIAGQGEDISKYIANIKNPERFEIRNRRIAEEEIDELFQKAFCTVLPYTDATQSGVIPVAFAYKTLVIATAVGALPEAIVHNVTGILVAAKDTLAIYEKMKWSIENQKEVEYIIYDAYEQTLNNLSWKKIAATTFDVYENK